MQKTFSIGKAFSFGWSRAFGNWKLLSLYALMVIAVAILMNRLVTALEGEFFLYAVVTVLNFLIASYFGAMGVKASLIEVGGQKVTWGDLWKNSAKTYWRFVGSSVLVLLSFILIGITAGIIIGLGMLLSLAIGSAFLPVFTIVVEIVAVLAAVYMSIRLKMSSYSVVAGAPGVTSKGSILESWNITKSNFWKLLWFIILVCLLNLVGVAVFFIGLLFTIPISMVAMAHVFRDLKQGAPAV